MAEDDRDLLEVLKFELSFLEHGGYGRSVRTPWKPTSMFEDSLTCLNFGDAAHSHPCDQCLLFALVPEYSRNENVPCHHIVLNQKGDTLATLDQGYNQLELEETLKSWLRHTIQRLERERAETLSPVQRSA
ncbi:MAG TPA: hypothetical protein VLC12_03040 [Terriglobales bacterium]|nr:hypothetical protein [Terriglobales bacterium]